MRPRDRSRPALAVLALSVGALLAACGTPAATQPTAPPGEVAVASAPEVAASTAPSASTPPAPVETPTLTTTPSASPAETTTTEPTQEPSAPSTTEPPPTTTTTTPAPSSPAPSPTAPALPPSDPWTVDCSVAPCIALTFDDGPTPGTTERILDTLARAQTPATFFMVGRSVVQQPALAARVAAEGHQIGNHTYNHPELTRLSPEGRRAELADTGAVIAAATGITPWAARPPYGDIDDSLRATFSDLGLTPILWTVDTLDWSHHDSQQTLEAVQRGAAPGAIILLHDVPPTTADALPAVIAWLQVQGYTLVTVEHLLSTS